MTFEQSYLDAYPLQFLDTDITRKKRGRKQKDKAQEEEEKNRDGKDKDGNNGKVKIKQDYGWKTLLRGMRHCLRVEMNSLEAFKGRHHWADDKLFEKTK